MSATDVYITAAEGRRVRHPGSGLLLAPDGEPVTWGSYWQRLLQDGDVTIVSPPPAPAAAAPRKDV